MKIKNMRYKDLPELYIMLYKTFEKKDKNFFVPIIGNNPSYINFHIPYIEENNRMVACNQIAELNTYMNGEIVKMGGIGQVGTLQGYRKKGYAGKLLDVSVEKMRHLNIGYSVLFAGPIPLYEKHGWKSLKVYDYRFKDVNIKIKASKDVIPYNKKFKLDMFDIHDEFIKNYNMTVIRNFLYWKYYWWGFRAKNTETYLLKKKNNVTSYMTINTDKDNIILYEYCSYDVKNEDNFKKLMNYVLKKKKKKNVYITYGNENYVPVRVLKKNCKEYFSNHQKGFMVRNINKKYDWNKIAENTLFFRGDSY